MTDSRRPRRPRCPRADRALVSDAPGHRRSIASPRSASRASRTISAAHRGQRERCDAPRERRPAAPSIVRARDGDARRSPPLRRTRNAARDRLRVGARSRRPPRSARDRARLLGAIEPRRKSRVADLVGGAASSATYHSAAPASGDGEPWRFIRAPPRRAGAAHLERVLHLALDRALLIPSRAAMSS